MPLKALLSVLAAALVGAATAAEPVAGRDYVPVTPALPAADPQKIVVLDFFSYACPHCFAFAPSLKAWESKLPSDVVLERVAISVGRQAWALPAQLYYTLRSMGKDKELDAAVFNALHVEHVALTSEDRAADWAAAHGLDRAAFKSTFESFSVQSFAVRGEQLARSVRLPSVPALVVDGQYLIAIEDNGGFESQLETVDALIAKARAERGLQEGAL